jgi:hypothetical protein
MILFFCKKNQNEFLVDREFVTPTYTNDRRSQVLHRQVVLKQRQIRCCGRLLKSGFLKSEDHSDFEASLIKAMTLNATGSEAAIFSQHTLNPLLHIMQ